MRNAALIIFAVIIMSFDSALFSQELPFRKEEASIDSILRKNPYNENFLGITYYYSIDITADRELVVKMDFDGPFVSTFSARISDLAPNPVVDTTEYSSSLCWHCPTDASGNEKQCVRQENHYTNGDNDLVMSDDICIMLPTNKQLRISLINSIEELVKKVASEK
jgi:hypothetical protein